MRYGVVVGLFFALALVAVGNAAAGQAGLCNGERPTITGTAGADRIFGTPGDDVILALGGDDWVVGRGGTDLLCGGEGNDRLEGGKGRDLVVGGSGRDRLYGDRGNDRLEGGGGNDVLFGGPGHNSIFGGRGDDAGVGEDGADRIMLGAGVDDGAGGGGADVIEGGPGNDYIDGHQGSDVTRGGPGADFCRGEAKTGCEPLEAGGEMEPGTYRYDGITPPVTVTIGEGWTAAGGLDYPLGLRLMWGEGLDQRVGITPVPQRVFDPATDEFVPLEEDLVTWLTSQECIDVISGPAPGSLAGATGVQVDFTVGACDGGFLRGWDEWVFFPYERDRFVITTVEGVEVIIYITTLDPSQFDAFLPTAEAVLDTVEFG